MNILRLIPIFLYVFSMFFASLSVAQAQTMELSKIEAPEFTTATLEAEIKAVNAAEKLTEEQKGQVKTYLETAVISLSNAAENLENRARFITEFENADVTLEELRESISGIKQEMISAPERSDTPIGEDALLQLEQDLIIKESEVRTLRAELEGYEAGLQNLTARQTTAPTELNEAHTKLGEIVSSLTPLGKNGLDGVVEANRKSLIARQYFRRTEISALEQEIAGLSTRQEIITARSNLTNLRLQRVTIDVQYLSEKTGQKRLNDALGVKQIARIEQQSFANSHPLLAELAKQNLTLTDDMVQLASDASNISKKTANTVSRLDSVEGDLRVANDFIKSGALDRRAGATLRRLSNQLLSPNFIRSQINETQKSRIGVTQKRLIAQEALREIPAGLVDSKTVVTILRLSDVDIVNLTDADRDNLQYLMNERSEFLKNIMNTASSRITETANLYEQQKALLESTEALKLLLDEKLLWVPSVPSIDAAWPAKVINGVFKVFSSDNVQMTLDVLFHQLQSLWFLVFVFTIAITFSILARKHLWQDILARSKDVGRVQNDNYWHTPAVIMSCIIIALPIPLILMLLWLLFELSITTSPFIEGLAAMFICLAFLFLFLLTWRAWDKDNSLFAAHYKLPDYLRNSVNKNLKWLMPVIGISTACIAVTESSTDADVYEGFGLFAFVVTALALSYFSLKVLWADRKASRFKFGKDNIFGKYNGIFTFICVGLPLFAAGLALFGYYDTANQLLGRIFLSAWLFLITYVVHGLIKRTVLIAQRQLAFRQAVEKRDAAAKARIEKLEAEERGEDIPPPPPVDTSEIDIKAISRQSSQLLNTLIVLAFAGLIWIIWSDLLPALSIFNDVKIGEYTGQIIDDAGVIKDVSIPITLWNLIQSVVILALTFIAAKNLPGFLEIFVLSRTGVDAGSRYAITTILGYIIIAVGVVIGFDKLGLQWSQLRWIVTGLSVGIGFGLQKIIANFISGLIILFERPVRIGDYVTIGDQSGTVSRIQIRATTLADLENREILIPNEALISERVTNWTLSNSVTRVTVLVGIAYGSDTDQAREIMLEALKANPKVLEVPTPQVLFMGFGDSSLDFELRVFLRNFDDRVPVQHMVHTDINKVLEEAGISIPFPQRDLNIVSDNTLSSVIKKPPTKPKPKPKTI